MADPAPAPPNEEVAEEIERKLVDSPWIERLARAGYVAKGIIFLTIGALALRALRGLRRAETDTQDALLTLAGGRMGTAVLVAIAAGLVGYIVWRLYQAWKDTERKGDGARGILQRLGYVVSAFFYGSILFTALQILRGLHLSDNGPEDWTERLLAYPWGGWLIGAAGLVLLGVGAVEAWRGLSSRFRREVEEGEMSEGKTLWFRWLGRIGLAARGLLYGMTGLFLVQSAWRSDPGEAGGLGKALENLAESSFGPWTFAAVAAGLIAYGLYTLAQARYRRFRGTR